jgi:uncharacterized Zn-binding protein involved in type VI secretion
MLKKVIRLGDPIAPVSHGGNVVASGAPHFTVNGIPVALLGDACSCHPRCVIVEGDAEHTIDGVPVAYEGHKTSCGRLLISTIETYTKG